MHLTLNQKMRYIWKKNLFSTEKRELGRTLKKCLAYNSNITQIVEAFD